VASDNRAINEDASEQPSDAIERILSMQGLDAAGADDEEEEQDCGLDPVTQQVSTRL
jgi:hypothetical protein